MEAQSRSGVHASLSGSGATKKLFQFAGRPKCYSVIEILQNIWEKMCTDNTSEERTYK